MTRINPRVVLMVGLATAGWLANGHFGPTQPGFLVATAAAVVGRPATPVSYAGVARRSTVGVGAPGVGEPRPLACTLTGLGLFDQSRHPCMKSVMPGLNEGVLGLAPMAWWA